jgi:hypothetical protein
VDYHQRRTALTLKNGQDAQAPNQKFQGLSASSSYNTGEEACVKGQLSQRVNENFFITPCASTPSPKNAE